MRIYIIGNDGITLCRDAPATARDGEIAVASKAELHAAPLTSKRLLALCNALPSMEKRRKIGDRDDPPIHQLWLAIEALPDPEPESDAKRPSKQSEVIVMLQRPEGVTVDEVVSATGWQRHRARRLLRNPEEARAHADLGKRGTQPGLPHRRTGRRMKSSSRDASARQTSGEPSPATAGCGDRTRNLNLAHIKLELAELPHQSTQDLRLAWRQLHRAGPPLGISRDLLIRAIANQLQEHTYGRISRALRRRLQSLAGEVAKGHPSFDSAVVVKPGTTLVRQWRGRVSCITPRVAVFGHQQPPIAT
jgi:hypothetical protein